MRCAAHILNLMVQDGMKVIQPAFNRIRDLIRHIASSGPKLQMFNFILKDLNMDSKRGLTQDCPIRWNSTYEMVSEALIYKDSLSRCGDEYSIDIPSFEEWKEAQEVANFLELFLDATKAFTSARRPSSHTYVKQVWVVRSLLLEDDIALNSILRDLAKAMQKKFDKYWENPNLIHTLACVFDPRCKLAFVKFYFRAAYGDATDIYNKNLESVNLALKEFYKDYENVIGNIDRATSNGSPQVEGRIYMEKKKLEMRFSQFQSQNQRVMSRNYELDTYLEKELVSFHEENFDIL
jgi:Domain of unknown function (DUF4413)